MAQQNCTPIVVRGNFLYDPYFTSARATIQQLVREIQKTLGESQGPGVREQICWPPDNMTNLMAIISKWQQVQASTGLTHVFALPEPSIQPPPPLNTIFHFELDTFQMLVDVRGYQPSEIRVSVSSNVVEVRVSHEDCDLNAVSANYANRTISKVYHLPRALMTEQSQCSLSNDGTLIIAAPWLQQP